MKYQYAIPMLLTALFISIKALAYDDYDYDEDDFGVAEAGMLLFFGACIALAGFIISLLVPLRKIGRGICIAGLVIGGIGVANVALMVLSWALTTALTLALYLGGLFVVGYILYAIYQWLISPKH
ncbi:hypothetical protein BD749_0231 [Pontibacter ramchanderi]|uniref:Uncharacterized protein n=2 Tax=Pontibacter ramchanderi TaxID=1179743 RepID=A0A2N3V137_9BACT|nr:hypothetical protein BD749_0231 [Pontibacter ramchanderi]